MRPQQQNRRMRGRNGGGNNNNNNNNSNNNNNNNNRRGPNPLTRNYESNGPDVKIRGSAQQIAEKYAQLARDAHSSGDRVMSENYLQHAEHYNRIIAAAQAQMPIQNVQNQRDSDDDLDDDRDDFDGNSQGQPNAGQQDGGQNRDQNLDQNSGQSGSGQSGSGQSGSGQGGQQGGYSQSVVDHNNGNGDEMDAPQANVEAGAGPQPFIEGVPAEVALNPEASSGAGAPRARRAPASSSVDGEARRSRRPRRGERARPEAGDDASDDKGGLSATLSRGAVAAPAEAPAEPKASGDAALADAEG